MGSYQLCSEPEEIRHFYKELPAVIDVTLGPIKSRQPRRVWHQAMIQILQIAVVPNINCSTRVHEVGDEEVGVELLLCR